MEGVVDIIIRMVKYSYLVPLHGVPIKTLATIIHWWPLTGSGFAYLVDAAYCASLAKYVPVPYALAWLKSRKNLWRIIEITALVLVP